MALGTLPLELHLTITQELDDLDIYHLAQSCKSMFNLIEGIPDVWKSRLKRMCKLEKLIWASYDGLSTALDFKNACIRPVTFIKRRTLLETVFLISTDPTTCLEEEREEEEGSSRSQSYRSSVNSAEYATAGVYLIPGGRFLVTLNSTCLFLWDLGPPNATALPTIILRHALGPPKGANTHRYCIVYSEVINDFTVQILLGPRRDLDYPEDNASMFKIIELKWFNAATPSIRELGRLQVVPDPRDGRRFIPEEGVAIHHELQTIFIRSGRITIAWNYSQKSYFSWVCDPGSGCILYIDHAGVHAIPLPYEGAYHLIQDETVSFEQNPPFSNDPIPCFSTPHPSHPVQDTSLGHRILGANVPTRIPDTGAFIYTIYESHDCTDHEGHVLSHYRYELNPLDPTASIIHLVDRTPAYWAEDDEPEPTFTFLCGSGWHRRTGVLWIEPRHYDGEELVDPCVADAALLPPSTSTIDSSSAPIEVPPTEDTPRLLMALYPWDDAPGMPAFYSLCAASGRLVVLWSARLEEEQEDNDEALGFVDFP
ncbi:hypothetical protein DFP72DRAFT_845478 [Ephemerocybe angulata]|uniref:F-box domain-containing protein n=1 Tax=Ephemerocybe angulata TaxID=980116 RepID=A0A8H6I339_9AGAR|nr:hypothetical protein DFP72DRAFT_845478 [Tulosesus angulatus]